MLILYSCCEHEIPKTNRPICHYSFILLKKKNIWKYSAQKNNNDNNNTVGLSYSYTCSSLHQIIFIWKQAAVDSLSTLGDHQIIVIFLGIISNLEEFFLGEIPRWHPKVIQVRAGSNQAMNTCVCKGYMLIRCNDDSLRLLQRVGEKNSI